MLLYLVDNNFILTVKIQFAFIVSELSLHNNNNNTVIMYNMWDMC